MSLQVPRTNTSSQPLVDTHMKLKNAMLPSSIESYQLQLRLVASEPSAPLWDRSGAARKFALRAGLLGSVGAGGYKSDATQH